MKTIKATMLLTAVTLLFSLYSCFENRIPEESELARYPSWQIFLAGRTGFQGICHNLDTGYYSFSFPTSLKPSEFFESVEIAAISEDWEVVYASPFEHSYKKRSDAYQATKHFDLVTLTYNPHTSEVTFVNENSYK